MVYRSVNERKMAKLAKAFHECDQRIAAGERDCYVVAKDASVRQDKIYYVVRRDEVVNFVVAKPTAFNGYVIMHENWRCEPYFDIDGVSSYSDVEQFVNVLLGICVEANERCSESYGGKVAFTRLTIYSGKAGSYHVHIAMPEEEMMFPNARTMIGYFKAHALWKNENCDALIDNVVYGNRRAFRLPYCGKVVGDKNAIGHMLIPRVSVSIGRNGSVNDCVATIIPDDGVVKPYFLLSGLVVKCPNSAGGVCAVEWWKSASSSSVEGEVPPLSSLHVVGVLPPKRATMYREISVEWKKTAEMVRRLLPYYVTDLDHQQVQNVGGKSEISVECVLPGGNENLENVESKWEIRVMQRQSHYCPVLQRYHKTAYPVYIVTCGYGCDVMQLWVQCHSNDCMGRMMFLRTIQMKKK